MLPFIVRAYLVCVAYRMIDVGLEYALVMALVRWATGERLTNCLLKLSLVTITRSASFGRCYNRQFVLITFVSILQ